MSWSERPSMGFPAFLLALGLAGAGFLIGGGLKEFARAKQSVTVKGYAEEAVRADAGFWTATLTVRSPRLAEGTRTLQNQMAAVTKFIEDAGWPAAGVVLDQVVSYPLMRTTESGASTSVVDSYVLSQRVSIEATDIAKLQQFTRRAPELLLLGYEITLEPTQYLRRELGGLKVQLLGRAIEDAQARAREMAGRTGRDIGRLRSTTQGVFQITAASSTEISSTGELDTASVDKKVRAVVTAEFELK